MHPGTTLPGNLGIYDHQRVQIFLPPVLESVDAEMTVPPGKLKMFLSGALTLLVGSFDLYPSPI